MEEFPKCEKSIPKIPALTWLSEISDFISSYSSPDSLHFTHPASLLCLQEGPPQGLCTHPAHSLHSFRSLLHRCPLIFPATLLKISVCPPALALLLLSLTLFFS